MRHFYLIAAAVLIAGCSPSEPSAIANVAIAAQQGDAHAAHAKNGDLTPEQKKAVADVRNATNRFHDVAVAKAAGYSKQYPAGCAVSPNAGDGAQGFHYLDEARVDGTVELLKPELVMYEPQPNGKLQLIGVDYVVPLTASATAPTLLGVPFMRNEPLGVWALHIWTMRPNPSGMFAAWNPKVSCEHASKATP